jgi:hypothetical protein
MNRVVLLAGLSLLMLLIFGTLIQSQDRPVAGPMTSPMMMGHYDATKETTIKGTVEKVEEPGTEGMHGMGLRLLVKSGGESFTVHLGPAAFVEKTMTFREGDAVEVTAVKMPMMGDTAFMAREVKKGDKVLKLRDENGMPLWMGMHGRHS